MPVAPVRILSRYGSVRLAAIALGLAVATAALIRPDASRRPAVPGESGRVDAPVAEVVVPSHTFETARREVLEAPVGTVAPSLSPPHAVDLRSTAGPPMRIVEGLVVRQDGSPAAHAMVALGAQGGACDAEGRFRIACGADVGADASLVAFEPGVQPAVLERFGARLPPPGRDAVVGPFRLDLGPPALSIDGVVVDARGVGQKGWSIRARPTVAQPTALGRPLEDLIVDGPRVPRSDRDGRFALGGFLPRRYELVATRGGRRIAVRCDAAVERFVRIEVPEWP